MTLALIVLGVVSLLELLLWFPGIWRWHKALSTLLVILVALPSGYLVVVHLSLWTAAIVILSIYRIVNLLRLVRGRTAADYLFHVALGSSLWLIAGQLMIVGLAALSSCLAISALSWWEIAGLFQLVVALVLLSSTIRHIHTTRPLVLNEGFSDQDLPSLTVAIPARNETEDLDACLRTIVESNYRKLEILVLDDCSQNKYTPEIIRSFAHSGVRFIAGEEPPEHWLAKNFAYARLAEEANGDVILFCGVDARFKPDSLRILVETMLLKKKTMLSIIPKNVPPTAWNLRALMVQPARYAWELALPRRWMNRPPILSTCWLINHHMLNQAGGFEAVSRSTAPESYFARYITNQSDGYSFMQSDEAIGLSTAKSFEEQRSTAIRTRYPQLHRRPELAGLLSLIELLVLVAPFIGLLISRTWHHWPLVITNLFTCVLLTIFYAKIVSLTYRRFMFRGLWLLPFVAIYDVGVLNCSLYRYEFGKILWKGRNVCLPVMRTIPRLPKLK